MSGVENRESLGTLKSHGMVKHLHALEEIIYFCLILILSTLVSKKSHCKTHSLNCDISVKSLSPELREPHWRGGRKGVKAGGGRGHPESKSL